MGILEYALVGAVVVLFLIVIWARKDGTVILSFLVGASAGLVSVQLWRVHVFTIVVLVWTLYRGGSFHHRKLVGVALLAVPVGLLALTSLLGDLVNSPTLALQLIALALSASAIVVFSSPDDRRQMLFGLLSMASLGSIVALLQVSKIIPSDLWHISVSALGRPTGIYPEPDWLGMFAGIGAVLAWRLSLRPWMRMFLVTLNASVFVLAFARAAWIAVGVSIAVVLVLTYVFSRRTSRNNSKGRKRSLLGLLVAALVVLVASPQLVSDLSTRLDNTFVVSSNDISAQARVRQFNALFVLAENSPFYGHGLSASGKVTVWGDIDLGETDNNVASNWVLAMWVDGRWLAIPMIVFLVLLAAASARTISGQGLIIVLLSSLFSNATFFSVMWLLIGLCISERMALGPKPALTSVVHRQAPVILSS